MTRITASEFLRIQAVKEEHAKIRTRPDEPEHRLQVQIVAEFRLTHPEHAGVFFAVPNGGLRNLTTAKKLKAEGAKSGVSDLILLVPNINYHYLCVEVKNGKRGRQQVTQKEFQEEVEKHGGLYAVVRTAEEARDLFDNYLNDV